jgi:predicted nucleotidyltransferase
VEQMKLIEGVLSMSAFPVLYASVVGSHLYGYATPASDYDIHGCYALPLETQLGFSTWKQSQVDKTPQMDISLHDIKKCVVLLSKGNARFLEALYSPLVLCTSPVKDALLDLAPACLSKQCANFYWGMARNQEQVSSSVKKLLHRYRCLCMGLHLMRTGAFLFHLPTLAREYRATQVEALIVRVQQGEPDVTEEEQQRHERVLHYLYERLGQEREQSSLPDEVSPQTIVRLEQLLIVTRLVFRA